MGTPRSHLFLLAALAVAGGCASPALKVQSPLAAYEQRNVYMPVKYPHGDWHPEGLKFEDAWFAAPDGTKLHGWFLPHDNPRAVALFAHGNAGNVSGLAESLRLLHDRHRIAVMAFDYRGYGRSDGAPDEAGVLSDARAARAWLARRAGVAERDIVLMGQSLGGGVVVDLAAKDGCRGLVLASTFASLPDVAAHHLPWLPTHRLMRNRFDSIGKIGEYHGPLLLVHGDRDRVVPYEQGKRLFAAANEPKRFVTNTGGDHNDPLSEEYRQALEEFLAELP
jgi:uncharacterized protein